MKNKLITIILASVIIGLTFSGLFSVVHATYFALIGDLTGDTVKIGDTVKVSSNVGTNVRESAGGQELSDIDYLEEAPSYLNDGYAPYGAQGRVINGPKYAWNHTWWKVEFISKNSNTQENGGDRKYTGWTVEKNLKIINSVSAKIDSYNVAPKRLKKGEKLTLKLKFTNTGNTEHTFIAGATLWGPDGTQKNFNKEVTLGPKNSNTISWEYYPDQVGTWGYQFAVWKNGYFKYQNLLDLAPGYSKYDINVGKALEKKPDLVVEDIWTEPSPPVASNYTIIGIKIKNQGKGDAIGTFPLKFYFDDIYKGQVSINGLTAGSNKTSYWRAEIWPADTNPHTIKSIVESNESNNQLSKQFTATQLPTCKIELQKDGEKIDKVNVGEDFDIVFTNHSGNIQKVRFLSDESQNEKVDEGFTWTDPPYNWNASSTDWDASNKIKKWSFATQGDKEVWTEVSDSNGQTAYCSANISASSAPALRTIYVPDDYSTIQAAVDAANPGDTIIVRDGTYTENINVNKDHLTIKSENGADKTIIQPNYLTLDSCPSGPAVFSISSNIEEVYGVKISGFTIKETETNLPTWQNYTAAFSFYETNKNEISDNKIIGAGYSSNFGIGLEKSSSNKIINNTLQDGSLFITDYSYFDKDQNVFVDQGSHNNIVKNNTVNGKPLVYLENASNQTITDAGQVILIDSNNITIKDLNLSNIYNGIELLRTNNSKIVNNSIDLNSGEAINLNNSLNNEIDKNNIYVKYGVGISLNSSFENTITKNEIDIFQEKEEYTEDIYKAISLFSSDNNTIIDNSINVNNEEGDGIELIYSSKNKIKKNIMNSNSNYQTMGASTVGATGVSIGGGLNNTITNNELNNVSIVLGTTDSPFPDHSQGNIVDGNKLSGHGGIFINVLSNQTSTIINNTFQDGGLFIRPSDKYSSYSVYHNIVENNTVNGKPLVYLENASNQTITDAGQVILVNSDNITIEESDLIGVEFWAANNNKIINNNINSNWNEGIQFFDSSKNEIRENNISGHRDTGIRFEGSQNNTIIDNDISNNDVGIYLASNWFEKSGGPSSNNVIMHNNVSNSWTGIRLEDGSDSSTIVNNTINSNTNGIGIYPVSSNNKIYLNNFVDNSHSYYYPYSNNIWNSTKKMTYTYKGKAYTNYLGNYWSDYKGSDTNGDGIGSTPYNINSDKDNYPLMQPLKNYITQPSVEMPVLVSVSANSFNPSLGETTIITLTNKYGVSLKEITFLIEGAGRSWTFKDVPGGGSVQITWDGRDNSGSIVPPGVYYYKDGLYSGSHLQPMFPSGTTIVLAPPENQLPTCKIELQKDGKKIDKVNVGEDFDIVFTNHSGDIKEVRFASDDSQNGASTGKWTDEYDWVTPSGDWNASTKIKKWSFATPGKKEVWAEIKDGNNPPSTCFTNIYTEGPYPVITNPLPTLWKWKEVDGPWKNKWVNLSQIAVSPNNPKTIYATVKHYHFDMRCTGRECYDGDEVYKSTNGGESWEPANEGLPCYSKYYWPVSRIVFAPSQPNIVYLATTDPSPYSSGVKVGKGIYLSADGGSWSPLGGPGKQSLFGYTYYPISSLAIDPTDPMRVYVGTIGSGIWRKEGVKEWEKIWDEPIHEKKFLDVISLAISPANPNIIYAAAYNVDPLYATGWNSILVPNRLIKSENGGNPGTWERLRLGTLLTATPKIDDIVVDNKNADIVYVITNYFKVYKSTDGGKNWDDASGTGGMDPLPFLELGATRGAANSIAMDRDFPDMIYATGEWGVKYIYFSPNAGDNAGENWFHLGDLKNKNIKKIVLTSNTDSHIVYAAGLEGLFKFDLSKGRIVIQKHSPGELRVYDSRNRITGLLNGKIKEEIPNSIYNQKNDMVVIFNPYDTYRYEVVGTEKPDEKTYGLDITSIKNGKTTTFHATGIPTKPKEVHQYTIDWDKLSKGEKGTTLKIDLEGDGTFDKTIKAGSELNMGEAKIETQIAVTKMNYRGVDILDKVADDIGDKASPLLLSELKESSIDLEKYLPENKRMIYSNQNKKLKMKFKFLETAGNEYQGKNINVKFKFLATQEK